MIDNLLPFRHLPVQPHQFGNALAFSHLRAETVGFHHSMVVVLMGAAQLYGHGRFIVQIGQRTFSIEVSRVQNGLRGLLDFLLLLLGWIWPREIVIDNVFRVSVIRFQASANHAHP